MIETRKPVNVLAITLRVALALVTIPVLLFLAELLRFILATGVGSEHDLNEAMQGGGLVLAAMSAIVLGWAVYALRGAWRILLAVPFAVVACFGLLSAMAASF